MLHAILYSMLSCTSSSVCIYGAPSNQSLQWRFFAHLDMGHLRLAPYMALMPRAGKPDR